MRPSGIGKGASSFSRLGNQRQSETTDSHLLSGAARINGMPRTQRLKRVHLPNGQFTRRAGTRLPSPTQRGETLCHIRR